MAEVLLPVYVVEGQVRVPATGLSGTPGWQVHVLLCPTEEEIELPTFAADVVVHRLEDLVPPELSSLRRFGGDDHELVLGESILAALIHLQPRHRFRLVQFAGCGPAMRVVQARRCRALPDDLTIAVELGEPGFWRRARGSRPPTGPRDLKLDHGERLAFAGADIQIALVPEVLEAARAAEWAIGDGLVTAELDAADYRDRLRPPRRGAVRTSSPSPSVSVTVTHHNHAEYLPGALASLAGQSRPADQVVVIDDGSTDAVARRVFEEQEALHAEWTFLRQENAGPGRTRNVGLERAEGSWFLPFDSDNLATPDMIERLLAAVDREQGPAAVACHNLAFVDDEDIAAGRFAFRYSPTGGPRVFACVENVYGDTCSLFHTGTLRSVGGFDAELSLPSEDWRTFVKLAAHGHRIDILPLPLFHYRTSETGRFRSAAADPTIRPRLKAKIVDHLLDSAQLSRVERRQLFEFLQAYEAYILDEAEPTFAEFRRFHESEIEDLDRFREAQLEELRSRMQGEVEAERMRAEAAEAEFASWQAATPRRLAKEAIRRLRRRIDPRARH